MSAPTSPASRLKKKLADKADESVKRELTTLCGEQVEVRGLMTGPRGRLMDVGFRQGTKGEGERGGLVPIYEKLYPILLVESLHEPTTGDRIFQRGDELIVAGLDPEEVDRVASIALKLSGLDAKAKDEAKNDSSEGTAEQPSSELHVI